MLGDKIPLQGKILDEHMKVQGTRSFNRDYYICGYVVDQLDLKYCSNYSMLECKIFSVVYSERSVIKNSAFYYKLEINT